MNFRESPWKIAAALSLSAATLFGASIDVSLAPIAWLRTGDSLSYEIPSWNYGRNAASYGLPVFPTDIIFVFVSATTNSRTQFDASLQSADGSVSQAYANPLTFVPGAYSSSSYSGAVSTLEGSLHLSAAISEQIFSGSEALLTLRNLGPAITLGLPPYTLQQDLFVSLAGAESSGGQLTVGALHGSVMLQASAPEPHSAALTALGGAFLWLLALIRQRFHSLKQS